MLHIQKTVFISYRRANVYMARAIYQNLLSNGFDVFLDYETINSGDWKTTILQHIESRAHFLIVLTNTALQNCKNVEDMLRFEVEAAVASKRNIVPLAIDDFDFGSASSYLPDSMKSLFSYNSLRVPQDFFDEALERLRTRFLNIPLEMVLHPQPMSKNLSDPSSSNVSNEVSPEQLKAEQYFGRAALKYEDGDLIAGLEYIDRAIELDSGVPMYHFFRGNLFRRNGNDADALTNYKKSLSLNPTELLLHRIWANIYRTQQKCILALEEIDISISLNPADHELYIEKGAIHLDCASPDLALDEVSKSFALNPGFARAFLLQGHIYRSISKYQDAIVSYSKAIEINPHMRGIHSARALIYQQLNELENAIADYSEVIVQNPNDGLAYYHRALNYVSLEKYELAIEDFTSCEKVWSHPNDLALVSKHRGYCYFKIGQLRNSIRNLTEAVDRNPGDWETLQLRGQVLYDLKDVDAALRDYSSAIGLNGKASDLYVSRALLNIELSRDSKQSIWDLTQAIDLIASPPSELFYYRGCLHFAQNDFAKASRDFDEALNVERLEVRAYFGRAAVKVKEKNHEAAYKDFLMTLSFQVPTPSEFVEAISVMFAEITVGSESGELLTKLDHAISFRASGELYFRRAKVKNKFGDLEQAIEDFGLALRDAKFPYVHSALMMRAEAYRALKMIDQAKNDYTRALNLLRESDFDVKWKSEYFLRRGQILEGLGQRIEAIRSYRQALSLVEKEARRIDTGIVPLIRKGKINERLKALEEPIL